MQLVGPQQTLGCQAGNGVQIQGAKEMVMFFGECRRLGHVNPPFHYFVCILDVKFCGRKKTSFILYGRLG